MKPATRDILYTIDRTILKVIRISAIVLLLGLIAASIFNFPKAVFRDIIIVLIAIIFGGILCRWILSPFVKSEEEEEFEKQVDYILQKKAKEKTQTMPSNYSPLHDLSQPQQEEICRLLRDLPSHANRQDAINMALIAQYLTALEQLDKADLKDKRALRSWVAEITGKSVPQTSPFNEAFSNTSKPKVAEARKELESIIRNNPADNPSADDLDIAN